MTPVFIFSLPRTGSTLLQRILSNHPDVATTAEPWVLLPLIDMKKGDSLSKFSSETSTKAINNFSKKVESGPNYNELLANFVLSLYKGAATNSALYFVDKPPRYYYIIDEIIELFPKAKFIFLFRNPVQVFSSILTTWNNNSFSKLYRNKDDLLLGPVLLSQDYDKYKNISISIDYQELVTNNEACCKKLHDYIGLSGDWQQLVGLNDNTFALDEMGDPTGQYKYKNITCEPLQKWHEIFNNKLRKWYLKKYIKSLGENVARSHHYSITSLLEEIDNIPDSANNSLISDSLGLIYQSLVYKYKLNIMFSSKVRKNKPGYYD